MVFNNEASSSSYGLNPVSPEETPLLPKPKLLSSQPKTFVNVFIAVVGAGVLDFPYSFKRTGWVVSLLMLFSVALLTHHCMMLLVRTRRRLESVMGFTNIASFGDLGFTVCGPIGRFAVDLMLFLSLAGFYVGYLIFIANTLANLFNSATLTNLHPRILGLMPKSLYIWGCFPFQLGLNSISTLTHLAPLSIFANLGSGWVSMSDGGVACKPLQHIMERLSIPEACCGGNNDNGLNSNSLKLEDSEPKKMKKEKKVLKKAWMMKRSMRKMIERLG